MQDFYNFQLLLVTLVLYPVLAEIGEAEPKFASVMPNATVVAGREAKLSCVVENLHNYKVAWVHYGEHGSAVLTVGTHVLTTNRRVSVEAERDTWALVIANATILDRGEYMCQISTVPPKKMYMALEVLVPPHIDVPPRDVTVNVSSNVTFECKAKGDPEPKITWRRELVPLPDKDMEKIPEEKSKGPVLILLSVTRKDAGAYLCVASNGVPPAVSARALLHINYGPVQLGENKTVLWASRGETTYLECKFDAYPKPKIVWYRSDKDVTNEYKINTKYSAFNHLSSTLYLRPETENAFGVYKCLAENPFGDSSVLFDLKEIVTTTTTTTTTTLSPNQMMTTWKPIYPGHYQTLNSGSQDTHKWNGDPYYEGGSSTNSSVKNPFEIQFSNRTKNGEKSRRIETSSPKRFVQESPFGQLYPNEDTEMFPTYSGSSPSSHSCLSQRLWYYSGTFVLVLLPNFCYQKCSTVNFS